MVGGASGDIIGWTRRFRGWSGKGSELEPCAKCSVCCGAMIAAEPAVFVEENEHEE
jgi:hypothetical protein